MRPVRANQVVYDERPVRKTRSVKKSAIIIGSSAGAGAGVGAAVGGKKGALIGAAIGGGGAALWDQMTRRKYPTSRSAIDGAVPAAGPPRFVVRHERPIQASLFVTIHWAQLSTLNTRTFVPDKSVL